MSSFGSLGIGLSFVFGFVLLGVLAEIYHLVRRRKEDKNDIRSGGGGGGGIEVSTLFCCKNPTSVETANSLKNPDPKGSEEPDLELGEKGFGEQVLGFGEEETVELELKRLHNLCGPPRFLFTIKEETKEDMESDDRSRKQSRTRSLSDLVLAINTPTNLTPLASPKKGNYLLESYEIHGFNPLFESLPAADFMSSPPPKLKFLRDAEEKFVRRLREEAEKRAEEERDASFVRISIAGENRESELLQ